MLWNYLKTAFRNIYRRKVYSIINIAGLALGLACTIAIILWVAYQLSYDTFHDNSHRIHRLAVDADFGAPMVLAMSMPIAGVQLAQEYPEVENVVLLGRPRPVNVKYEDAQFMEQDVGYASNSLFEVFSFKLLKSSDAKPLIAPYTVVLTAKTAEKYFGSVDPLGKTLILDGTEEYTVTGIVEDVPKNSHFSFSILRSFETMYSKNREELDMWFNIQYYVYLLLAEGTDYQDFEAKLPEFIDNNIGETLKSFGGRIDLFLQPLESIYLHSKVDGEIGSTGDIDNVYLLSAIAIFILIIACVNYINLATALSATREKEVGIRKTLGADRGKLIRQFLVESIIISIFSMLFALLLLEIASPILQDLTGLRVGVNIFQRMIYAFSAAGFTLLIGVIAGIYPAFILSSFRPVHAASQLNRKSRTGSGFRTVLVIGQFTISIALMIGTVTIYRQLDFLQKKDLGFEKSHKLIIPNLKGNQRRNIEYIKNELKSIPGITGVSVSSMVPGRSMQLSIVFPEGFSEDQPQTVSLLEFDPEYIPLMDMNLTAGRNFSSDMQTDPQESIIVNESLVRKFGWENPLGKKIQHGARTDTGEVELNRTIIGVVEDFHQTPLHNEIMPIIIGNFPATFRNLTVLFQGDKAEQVIEMMKRKWESIDPNEPLHYYFLDESLQKAYKSDYDFGKTALVFSLLAVFIGCMGLFGMSSFTAEQRTKEIGVRKALGAKAEDILQLLTRKFLFMLLFANALAWPAAYFGMTKWLENYAYKIDHSEFIWIFPLSALTAIILALLTVSYRSIKAANTNPVKALRYE